MENITKEKLGELDPLTGLLNNKVFMEQVAAYLQTSQNEDAYAFLIFDIDDFENVNDNWGHPMGDQVIIQTGNILKDLFSQNAFVSRIGGDEFCVFCFALVSMQQLKDILDKICNHTVPMQDGIFVTYSCGVVFRSGADHSQYGELYKSADHALYQAKHQGKKQYYLAMEDESGQK